MPDNAQDVGFDTAASGVEDHTDLNDGSLHRGLSHSPGLREIADSPVPGAEHSHVHGPQQMPVDPVAAGLETRHVPLSRAEDRMVTRTGEIASGVHAPGTPAAVSDGPTVPAPRDPEVHDLPAADRPAAPAEPEHGAGPGPEHD